MSLSKQLLVLICSLVIVLFAGNFAVNLQSTRAFLNDQLASLAQDTATSLAFSASVQMGRRDRATVRSIADAVFDSGEYAAVRIEGEGGTVWVDRRASRLPEGVPAWFVEAFPLSSPEGTASLMADLQPAGTVRVRGNPAHAYRQLWQTARDGLLWFLLVAALMMAASLTALRLMLRPLKAVERQAAAICRREFPVVPGRPFTLEFRNVVEAMNRLSGTVRLMLDESEQLAEQLRQQAFVDPVTGLANRRRFMNALGHWIEDPEGRGDAVLLLLQLKDFKAYNQQAGYAAGDALLRRCAEVLQSVMPVGKPALVSHTAGADFAVFIGQVDEAEVKRLAHSVSQAVAGLYGELSLPSADVAHVGAVPYQGQTASQWLGQADMALRQAQRSGANQVFLSAVQELPDQRGAGQWRELLQEVLEQGTWQLVRQPVLACADKSVLHQEVFLRIPDPEQPGSLLPAGRFLPMAEGNGLASALDRAVLRRVLDELAAERHTVKQAVNISPASLRDEAFIDWLRDELRRRPRQAAMLILEFPEYGAVGTDGLSGFFAALEKTGVEYALDNFGNGFSGLANVRGLGTHYLKLSGSLVHSLVDDPDARFFVQALTRVAHGSGMRVVADAVESAEIWALLPGLGVDAGRGYWLAEPE